MGTHCAMTPLSVEFYCIQAVFVKLPTARDVNVNGVQKRIMGDYVSPTPVLNPYF
jgi:hypothetical protein